MGCHAAIPAPCRTAALHIPLIGPRVPAGLRQCKASLYEGGIRVPGILEWSVYPRLAYAHAHSVGLPFSSHASLAAGHVRAMVDWREDSQCSIVCLTGPL